MKAAQQKRVFAQCVLLGIVLLCASPFLAQINPNSLGHELRVNSAQSDAPANPLGSPGAPPVALSPTSLSFGNQDEGVASSSKTLLLKNAQGVPLTITSIVTAGGNAPQDYSLGGNCPISPATLGPGSTCSITVTFTPTLLGSITSAVTITDNASNSPQTANLNGYGAAPVSVSPLSIAFGSYLVGTTSSARTVTVLNHLSTELFFSSIVTSGNFAVASNTCAAGIPAGATCTIGVTFTPYTLGSNSGQLTINDSAFGSPSIVALSGTGNDNGLSTILVTPSNSSIVVGNSQQFAATGYFTNGNTANLTPSVTWSSSQTGIATISSVGLATAVTAGTSNITAILGSVNGSTTLTVAPALVSIAVTPANASLVSGTLQQFAATGTYSDGSTQNLTNAVIWSSSAASIASISSTGMVNALSQGSVSIGATLGSIQGATGLTVTAPVLASIAVTPANNSIAPGNTQQFTATGTYSDGSTQNLTSTATWSSTSAAVATISNASGSQGLASAVAIGSTTITAASGTISGSTNFTVTGFALTGSLNTPREFQTSTLQTNDSPILIGGTDNNGNILGSAEIYNSAAQTFSYTGNLNTARSNHTATLLNNGAILIAGGVGSGSAVLASAELYSSASGSFTPTGSLNTARSYHTATLLNNGTVLIAGGIGPTGGSSSSAELYNPSTSTFTPTGTLNTARSYHTATLLNNGVVLIAGGIDGTGAASSTAELYNTANATFTPTGSLNTARSQHTATLLNNGMVLIAGGMDATGAASLTAELYNPASGTFTPTSNLNQARSDHTATLLNDGMILIAGGTAAGSPLASAELYDPVAAVFNLTASLNNARSSHTAVQLANGMTLIAGGMGSAGVTASAELYQPATLTPQNLVSIALAPTSVTIEPGANQQFIATGTFSNSSTQQISSATWTSSNPTAATITDDPSDPGWAYAVADGSTTVSACAGLICGSATLNVSPPVLVSIAVSPANNSVQVGSSLQFYATGTYTDGSMQDLTSTAVWNSSAPTVATAAPGGLATTATSGSSVISAGVGAVTGSTTLLVTTPAQMPTGTISDLDEETCPSILGGQPPEWVTQTSGGSDVVAVCYHVMVSCPNMPTLGVTYGVATPSGTSNGTIAFISASGGYFTLPGSATNEAPFDLYHAGFQTVQFAWDSWWQGGSSAGSLKQAACREATFLNYLYTNVYLANSNNSVTAGMCAHSQSGGAGGLAFSLTYYGVSSFLDKVVFVSGPHYASLVQGCVVPNSSPVTICPETNGSYPMGCNSANGSWTDDIVYFGNSATELSQQLQENPPCNDSDHVYTQQDEANLIATSLLDDATDASYVYPQTSITAWECDDDTYWNNPSEGQGSLYLSQLSSPLQVASNCNYASRNTAYPNACLSINRVYGCTSAELAATGYICNGVTCPVCTGSPATNCTCGGVACSKVSESYAMNVFRDLEWEDPINGCIRRH